MAVFAPTKSRPTDIFTKLFRGLGGDFSAPTQSGYPDPPSSIYLPAWLEIRGQNQDDIFLSEWSSPATGSVSLYAQMEPGNQMDTMMAELEHAASDGNEKAFIDAANVIDWNHRNAEDLVKAVQLALSAGAYLKARKIAEQGAHLFPRHNELIRYTQVLAPPKVMKSTSSPHSKPKENRDWIMNHAQEYRGRWVALKDGKLLASAQSMRELINQIGDPKDGEILVTQVW